MDDYSCSRGQLWVLGSDRLGDRAERDAHSLDVLIPDE